jgi:hypothetical protein
MTQHDKLLPQQSELFAPLKSPPPDNVIQYCLGCGREIAVVRYTRDGYSSDFISREGRCYQCTNGGLNGGGGNS